MDQADLWPFNHAYINFNNILSSLILSILWYSTRAFIALLNGEVFVHGHNKAVPCLKPPQKSKVRIATATLYVLCHITYHLSCHVWNMRRTRYCCTRLQWKMYSSKVKSQMASTRHVLCIVTDMLICFMITARICTFRPKCINRQLFLPYYAQNR